MDKNVLKKFAIESRQELMSKVANKIKTFYIDEDFSKQQNGDIIVLLNEKHSLSLSKKEYEDREKLKTRIKELGLEQVIEEAAYTWFNRIIAIRYMEIHDYLPLTKDNQSLGIRVLSSKDNTPNPEIMKFTNLVNPELDIDFKKEKYIELKDDNKKFEYILLLICKKLGKVIPQVFDGVTDYIDLLLPDNLLNDSGYITKLINDVSEQDYKEVEIIGWLYQFWNTEVFNKIYDGDMSRKKLSKYELPAATQLFTPDWVVRYMVENSLGKYWMEHSHQKSLMNDMKYYIGCNSIFVNEIKPEEIKCIDPCSGSGHILIYYFELLYKIYLSYGYRKQIIPRLILENNIYGMDIDDRAGQLSVLSVLLKAREYDKNIFNIKNVDLNIISLKESSNEMINWIKMSGYTDIIKDKALKLINDFKYIKEIGSLLKIEKDECDYKDLEEQIAIDDSIIGIQLKKYFFPLIKQYKLLTQKYDIVVTNPPYLSNARMGNILCEYVKKEYANSKLDMCVAFIDAALNKYCVENGYIGFITTKSWMYIQSFEKFRTFIIENYQFESIVDFGTELFDGKIGHLPIVAWVNKVAKPNSEIIAVKLSDFCYAKRTEKKKEFFNKNNYFYISQSNLKIIPGNPLAYWIADNLIEDFEKENLSDYANVITGMTTGNNDLYLKLWYEVKSNRINFRCLREEDIDYNNAPWIPYSKGGNRRKWFGNYDYVVNWSKNNEFNRSKTTLKHLYFKKALTWPFIGGKFSARILDEGFLWDVAGSPCFVNDDKYYYYILGFLNSVIADECLNLINPTINRQAVDLSKLPIIINDEYLAEINNLVKKNIDLSKDDWNSYEISWNFARNKIVRKSSNDKIKNIQEAINKIAKENEIDFLIIKNNEEQLNKIYLKIYNLEKDYSSLLEEKDITINKCLQIDEIKAFISYAVGCMFGRYSLDEEGLIYAGGDFDINRYKTFNVDTDNIIPITDEAYFSDDIVERFKTFIKTVYGNNTFNENMDFIAEALGKKGTETSEETIRRYFVNDFFNDHVKMYQKRPIYWLLDSGKKNGFKALIYMHRYNENLIPKARLDYLHRVQTTYEKLLSDINYKLTTELSMIDKKEAKNRQADLNAKLNEIKEYDEKIAHIANQRISIDLDDGVKVNYEKFKDILAKIK